MSDILTKLVARDDNCDAPPDELDRVGLRIGSIFIILVASFIGALAPVVLARQKRMHVPKFTFFICKYVGTGVIIATAFMHLLDPAVDAFSSDCVSQRVPDYPWALAIALMVIMVMFLIELIVTKIQFNAEEPAGSDSEEWSLDGVNIKRESKKKPADPEIGACDHDVNRDGIIGGPDPKKIPGRTDDISYPPGGQDHLAHAHSHSDKERGLSAQITAVLVLEFGVIFHSVFVGLVLGTTDELVTLIIVLVFHQMFEGLGLGSRLATAQWPEGKGWAPYMLALMFAISTPVGIAAGLGAKPSDKANQTLVNGIFDSISAGILMYTGLVELLGHEFMFNPHMRRAPFRIQLFAFACIIAGAFVMALLANWA